jgi:two-component system LytT family response regulator
MRIIIIDDEAPAREIIKSYLKDYTDIEVCAEYSDGFSGLKGIKEHHPDLIFLDIQMPKITGFEMLELLENHPEIIFTTAYDQYAIKAFEINAVDYLLKPFSKERFNKALTKVKEKLTNNNKNKQTGISKKIIETIDKEKNDYIFRIVVKKKDNIHVIPVDNLIYIEAKDDYVMLYTENSRYLKEKTMKYYETHLDPRTFVRVHRSYIVRINQVKRLEPYGKSSYIAILQQGQKVNVSLSGYKKLKEILNF